jgi:hypothetical protein
LNILSDVVARIVLFAVIVIPLAPSLQTVDTRPAERKQILIKEKAKKRIYKSIPLSSTRLIRLFPLSQTSRDLECSSKKIPVGLSNIALFPIPSA